MTEDQPKKSRKLSKWEKAALPLWKSLTRRLSRVGLKGGRGSDLNVARFTLLLSECMEKSMDRYEMVRHLAGRMTVASSMEHSAKVYDQIRAWRDEHLEALVEMRLLYDPLDLQVRLMKTKPSGPV